MIKSIILKDTYNEGNRITTFILTYPRFIHPQLLTHRTFSRNSTSSRAMPVSKVMNDISNHPVFPIFWGKNKRGMSTTEELSREEIAQAKDIWSSAERMALKFTNELLDLGVHKQTANRLLEPFMHITTLLTGTDFKNFFKLRCAEDAQPEIQALAMNMKSEYDNSKPVKSQYHIPFIEQYSGSLQKLLVTSVARCARVSYKNHDNTEASYEDDFRLFNHLRSSNHLSPFEHQAFYSDASFLTTKPSPMTIEQKIYCEKSNFCLNWVQYRKLLEACPSFELHIDL